MTRSEDIGAPWAARSGCISRASSRKRRFMSSRDAPGCERCAREAKYGCGQELGLRIGSCSKLNRFRNIDKSRHHYMKNIGTFRPRMDHGSSFDDMGSNSSPRARAQQIEVMIREGASMSAFNVKFKEETRTSPLRGTRDNVLSRFCRVNSQLGGRLNPPPPFLPRSE